MKSLFAAFLVAHGLIHLLGTVRAFRIAPVPLLTQQIGRPLGIVWSLAAVLFIAAAICLFTWPRWWWAVGGVALVLSQLVIASSWSDARFGTIANVLALAGVAFGFLSHGPASFRAEYEREVARGVARPVAAAILSEHDVASLPSLVQRYIRLSGAIGRPRVHSFRARFHGQIRSGPAARWMTFTGEQYNFFDQPSRLFLMDASLFGLPVQAFHEFVGPAATMRVKLASLVSMVDAKGPEMDQAETVTLFNDLCVMAPGAMINPQIRWREIDAQSVGASFTNARYTIHAVLTFNALGELINFTSDGRAAAAADGKSSTRMPWSTPLSEYRAFGSQRLMSHGEGIWHAPAGDYSYLRYDLDVIEYNVAGARPP